MHVERITSLSSKELGTFDIPADKKPAIVLGNEDHGISDEILNACDSAVIIPMKSGVDSLNVAAASAVTFWEVFQ